MGIAAALPADRAEICPGDVVNSWQAIHFPLASLLTRGGDERLRIDPATGLNVYGCAPHPRTGTIEFCSSTASSISETAFARIGQARDALVRDMAARGAETAFEQQVERMRRSLLLMLGLVGSGTDVVFSPSGTDSQLHALFLAKLALGGPVTSIVCAADQTGSGTAFTSRGQHYSASTALGETVEKGASIDGEAVTSIPIPLFREDGTRRSAAEIDHAVMSAVEREIASGRKVLLQIMDSSKLGWRAPSEACAEAIALCWPRDVQIVVDACQLRSGRTRLKSALERGWMVLVTGSKFFTAPGFCGATLVPRALACRIADRDAPNGLAAYATRFDLPAQWQRLRAALSAEPNFGQWLRWEAALEEMSAFYALPSRFAASLFTRLSKAVPQIMAGSRSLEWMKEEGGCPLDRADGEMPVPTVFPFFVKVSSGRLSHDAMVNLYRVLNRELALGSNNDERRAAATLCHIGQPVKLPCGSVLRLALGARTASEAWHGDEAVIERNVKRIIENIHTVTAKIDLLAEQS